MHEATNVILHGLNGDTADLMGQLQVLILGGRQELDKVRNEMSEKEMEK